MPLLRLFSFMPYVLKTLWRHRSRTLLTASGSAVALSVFCFVGAVQEGMNDLQARQEAKQTLITFQANKFCPATSHLPQDYEHKIANLSGVRDVTPIQVFTNNCRASLDVVVFYGLPAERLKHVRQFEMIAGSWSDFERSQDAAMVGRAVADRRGKKVGDKFSIGDITVSVAGIFSCDNPAEENYIYTHLDYLQRRKGVDLVGRVTQFEVQLQPNVDATQKCDQIDALFQGGPVATDTRPKGAFQAKSLGDLTELIGLAHYLGLACMGLVFALVATTTFMSVQDRMKEHAVLQTIGISGPLVFSFVLFESFLLSAIGGLVGVGAAMIALEMSGIALGAEAVMIAFRPTWRLAGVGIGVALVTGLLAGLAPAWQAARVEIVSALRQR